MTDTTVEPNERYKVGRVISKYDLQEFHAELPDRWLGAGREAQSLRELADELNVATLRAAMTSANLEPLDGEVANTYRLLIGDEVSSGMRISKRNQLKREGLDVDSVTDDFVTHQAIYTYLTEVLDVSKRDREESDPVEKHSDRINRLRSRAEAVTSDSIDSLVDDGAIKIGAPEVSVSIEVYCQECNKQYPLSSLLTRGECDCRR